MCVKRPIKWIDYGPLGPPVIHSQFNKNGNSRPCSLLSETRRLFPFSLALAFRLWWNWKSTWLYSSESKSRSYKSKSFPLDRWMHLPTDHQIPCDNGTDLPVTYGNISLSGYWGPRPWMSELLAPEPFFRALGHHSCNKISLFLCFPLVTFVISLSATVGVELPFPPTLLQVLDFQFLKS